MTALVEMIDADFAALLAGQAPRGLALPDGGVERPKVLTMLRGVAGSVRPSFAPASWLVIHDGELVGMCSVLKSPAAGTIEVGYGIAASRRGRGHAAAAIRALLAWAEGDRRVSMVEAETSIRNVPSQRVLERNGFRRTGARVDEEDGAVIGWVASAERGLRDSRSSAARLVEEGGDVA